MLHYSIQYAIATCTICINDCINLISEILKFCVHCTMTDEPGFTARQLLIAQLGQVTFLNGSDVCSTHHPPNVFYCIFGCDC